MVIGIIFDDHARVFHPQSPDSAWNEKGATPPGSSTMLKWHGHTSINHPSYLENADNYEKLEIQIQNPSNP